MKVSNFVAMASPSSGVRADELFNGQTFAMHRRTDRLFAILLPIQWVAAVVTALTVSPRAWAGGASWVHPHVWAAVLLAGVIVSLPTVLALTSPGARSTRHVVAVAQMLIGSLLIHLGGGRIETHFHVFVSLAFLALYRDWRVLITASACVAGDHILRGWLWPLSIYGVQTATLWRSIEHASWVAFEDVLLALGSLQTLREMREVAGRQAEIESTRDMIEGVVRDRTVELRKARDELERRVLERTDELEHANGCLFQGLIAQIAPAASE